MKLRIRNGVHTRVLSLPEGPKYTLQQIKSNIRRSIASDLHILSDQDFDLSLNGKTSLGSGATLLDKVGVVSGDLLKIIVRENSPPPEFSGEVSQTQSEMSVEEEPLTSWPLSERAGASSGPLVLQDYTNGGVLPSYLQDLYSFRSVCNEFHAICIIFHNLLLESEFSLQKPSQESTILNTALHSPLVNLDYIHPAVNSLHFYMTCNPLGPFVLVNGWISPCVNTEEHVLTLQVKIGDFVKNFNTETKPPEANKVYKNLAKLSRLFKEEIAYKAINNMREEMKLPPLHGLLALFPELLLRILSQLDAKSLCAVSQVCHRLADVSNEDILWKALCAKDFPSHSSTAATGWKTLYKSCHIEKRQEEQRRQQDRLQRERELEFVSPFDPYPQIPIPMPGQPTGMIGGDYDLDPTFPYGPFGGRRPGPPQHPFAPRRPRMPGSGNPLPGSRFDPMGPFGGGFRPGRGGGMMDDDFGMRMPQLPGRGRGRRGFDGGGFGGGFL